ncbi:cation-translocating P-type ATPase [Microcoleus sp.]|uniref:cation-translocating P-type ATPase n=1 Tax=Microcoleus sp. TaxID=44472 RepID=UPI0035936886
MKASTIENLTEQQWHKKSTADAAKYLKTDLETGLSDAEVPKRQKLYGFNELKGKAGKSPILRFLMEFNQPLIYILLVAGIVTLLLRDWVDAGVILGVMFINAVIGFIQESKAENAIAALAKSVTTEATIIRDGQKVRLNSRELVPGDLVLLASGDKVPADLRLVAVRDLQVSESALTGESVPVQKATKPLATETVLADRSNMAYAGSLVTLGQAKGIVVAIANQTEAGRISQLMEQSDSLETPLTRKIEQFSKSLLYVILGLAAFMFAVVMGKGGNWTDGFKAAVTLAVSAIPEGLPAVVTVTLALGVGRMAQRHAIIRKLPAVETLGSTTVICSDKTGTLTENQMTVQAIYAGGSSYAVSGVGYIGSGSILQNDRPIEVSQFPMLQECLQCGLLCNDSHIQEKDGQLSVAGDPTEGALIVSAQKAGLALKSLEQEQPRLDTIPFESQFQYMATLHQDRSDCNIIYVKGSAESILKRCSSQLDSDDRNIDLNRSSIEQTVDRMAAQGLRVLAFAKKDISAQQQGIDHEDLENDLVFLGLQGMIDPPRVKAIAAIRACQSAGIQVKMITGDHALTAAAIARQIGLSQDRDPVVFEGKQIAAMDDRELANAVEISNVFARVAPEQKLRLVEALQAKGEIVAMTGDGVNDAPALKQADIGIAMGITGTEVAKEAADMILTDDNFTSIEAAVEEGRTVYGNLLKTIGFILPVNGGEAMTILVGILAGTTLPILPVQILWVNMVSSVALSATLAFEPKSADTMQRSPRRPNEPLLTKKLLWRILIISTFNLIAVLGIFEWVSQTTGNVNLARTMAVHTLVAAETFYLLSISQFVPSLFAYLQDRTQEIAYIPAIGVACVFVSQIFFSQVSIINPLFNTQPLSAIEALIAIGAGLPVIIPALFLKRLAPFN